PSCPTSRASRPTTRSGSRRRCRTRPTNRLTTSTARSAGAKRRRRPRSSGDVTAALRAGVLAVSLVACTRPRPSVSGAALARVARWWIVIGDSPMLESLDWRHYAHDAQMVVLSGDPRIPIKEFPPATIRLAYLSVGEADTRRPYWAAIQEQPFLVEPNPDWPGVRVDIRDRRWQEVL